MNKKEKLWNCWTRTVSNLEQFSNHLCSHTNISLNKLAPNNSNEASISSVSHCFSQQCLTCPWRTIAEDTLRRINSKLHKFLRMQHGQLNNLEKQSKSVRQTYWPYLVLIPECEVTNYVFLLFGLKEITYYVAHSVHQRKKYSRRKNNMKKINAIRTSRIFWICSLHPPTSLYVTSGFSSTVIKVTLGSILGGKGICIRCPLPRSSTLQW